MRLSVPLNNCCLHCQELHWQYDPEHPVRDVLEGIIKCQNWIDWALVKNTNSIYFYVLMLQLQPLAGTESGQWGKWQQCQAGQLTDGWHSGGLRVDRAQFGEILGKDSSSGRIRWPPDPRSQILQQHKCILNSNTDLLNSALSCATFSHSSFHLLSMPFSSVTLKDGRKETTFLNFDFAFVTLQRLRSQVMVSQSSSKQCFPLVVEAVNNYYCYCWTT